MQYKIEKSLNKNAIFEVSNSEGRTFKLCLPYDTYKARYVCILRSDAVEKFASSMLTTFIADTRNNTFTSDYTKSKIEKCKSRINKRTENPIPLNYCLAKLETYCVYERTKKWLFFSENKLKSKAQSPSINFDDDFSQPAFLIANNVSFFPVITDKESADIFYQYRVCDRQFGIVRLSEIFDEQSDCFQRFCQSSPMIC